MKIIPRRKFILSSATVGIGSLLTTPSFSKSFIENNMIKAINHTGFDQAPLPY